MTRIDIFKASIQSRIKDVQERIAEDTAYIKQTAGREPSNQSIWVVDVITFLPGKIKDLEEAMKELKNLKEQLRMVNAIEEEAK